MVHSVGKNGISTYGLIRFQGERLNSALKKDQRYLVLSVCLWLGLAEV